MHPSASPRLCSCIPSQLVPSGSGDTVLSRRVARDVARLLTCAARPIGLATEHPDPRDHGASRQLHPAEPSLTTSRPLLDRFSRFQVASRLNRHQPKACAAANRLSTTSFEGDSLQLAKVRIISTPWPARNHQLLAPPGPISTGPSAFGPSVDPTKGACWAALPPVHST